MKHLYTFLFFCVACTLTAQNSRLIQDAMANYDYEVAISLINKEKPTIPLLMQKGKAQKGLGCNRDALDTFRQVLAADSANQQAYIEAAECCKALTGYKEALEYYRKALGLNPTNKYTRLQFISMLCQTGCFPEAFRESSDMVEVDSSAVVLHLQAQSLEGMQDVIPAIGCYQAIQKKYPTDYLAAAKLGNLYISQKAYDKAVEVTELYRESDSINQIVNQQNALAYCLSQQYPMAINRYEALCREGDSSTQTIYYLGISYYASEMYYEAHSCFEKLLKIKPDDANLLYYMARCCAKTSWKKEGVEYMEKAIRLTIPDDTTMIRLYRGLADCCKLAGNGSKQVQAISEQYYKYDKSNHKLLYDIAWTYSYLLKDDKMTIQYLTAFLKTKKQDSKGLEPAIDKDGIVLGIDSYYNAAARWLDDIRKEKFFREGSPQPQ